jgi:hypothetical protein
MVSEWVIGRLAWGVDWIRLAQDRDRWPGVVNVVMNLRVHVTRSSEGCHSRCNSMCRADRYLRMVRWNEGDAIKYRPELNVFAHDLMRGTKGLGCQID